MTDGRVARGERTRRAIVDAHTDLVRAGVLRPTAQLVADRAGIAVRTLWSNFGDLEGLLRATTARWLEMDDAVWIPVDPDLPLEERIALFCSRRADRMEHLGPAARSSALAEPFSPALRAARDLHTKRLQDDLVHTFGAEIGATDGPHAAVHAELYLLACWQTWWVMSDDLGLDHDRAVAATTDGFRRVLSTISS